MGSKQKSPGFLSLSPAHLWWLLALPWWSCQLTSKPQMGSEKGTTAHPAIVSVSSLQAHISLPFQKVTNSCRSFIFDVKSVTFPDFPLCWVSKPIGTGQPLCQLQGSGF